LGASAKPRTTRSPARTHQRDRRYQRIGRRRDRMDRDEGWHRPAARPSSTTTATGSSNRTKPPDDISVAVDALPAPPAAPVATLPGPSLPPSNAFSILTAKLNARTGAATLRFRLAGPGLPRGLVTSKVHSGRKASTLTVARFTRTATQAGVITVKLTPGRRAIHRLRERRRLAASLRATFTPKGGSARTVTRAFTLRLARR
jgi:hypothetical protein